MNSVVHWPRLYTKTVEKQDRQCTCNVDRDARS